ncbi:putative Ig domain-containing protein [Marmoricola sp. RAF53]|uniref:putative Ig domain-containing protein n=1 Tax=Marmoricola sp. RAF53 TaxID=3233059 RepID=UPI003F98336F
MRTSPRPFLLGAVLAALLSVLLVAATLAPAQAVGSAVARTLSAKPGTSAAVVRSAVLVTGTLSRSPKGSAVKVQRLSGKKWVPVKTTRTTSAGGAYSLRIPLPGKSAVYSFRATAPSSGRLKSAVSRAFRISALSPVAVDMGALPSVVAAGSATTFFGSVFPYVAGTTVAVQQLAGSTWSTVTTVKLNRTGNFNKAFTVTRTGTYRVLVPRVGLKASSYSPAVTVTATPVIATTSLPNGLVGRTYAAQLTAVGGATGTWTASPLPAGVSLNPATGRLSGRPTTAGQTDVKIGFKQAGTGSPAPSRTLTLTVTVPPKPVITTTTLPEATSGNPYRTKLAADGDPAGTWTATPLPAGLHLDGATGEISGTPTGSTATTQVTVGFTEATTGESATARVLALKVNPVADPVIATSSLPVGGVTQPYSATLAIATAQDMPAPPGTWSAAPLPDGLSIDPGTGTIHGTPTAGGTTQVVVGFTQTSTGRTASKTLALKVNALPVISTTSLPTGVIGRAYAAGLTAQDNPAGTWTAAPLPEGLSLNPGTGAITGSPTETGSTQVVIGFTETATGLSASKTLPLPVVTAPVITTASLPVGGVGKSYSATLTVTAAGSTAGTWSASPLPAGLSLNTGTGAITGTPTTGGTTQVQLGFTQASTGVAATPVTVALKVNPLPVIETTSLPNGHSGRDYNAQLKAVGNPVGTWAVSGLPSTMTLDPNTGVISGKAPVVLGSSYPLTIVFTETATGLTSAPKQITITVTLL